MSMLIPLTASSLEIPDRYVGDYASGHVRLMGNSLTTRLVDAQTNQVVCGARIVPASGSQLVDATVPTRGAHAVHGVVRAAQTHPYIAAGAAVLVLASGATWYVLRRRKKAAERADAEGPTAAEMALVEAEGVVDAEFARLHGATSEV